MITPLAMRTTRTACRSTTSTWRGSRLQRAAKATASGRGSTVVQVDDRALRLGDDLLGHHDDVVGAEGQGARRRREGVAEERREVVARADLGERRQGEDQQGVGRAGRVDGRPGTPRPAPRSPRPYRSRQLRPEAAEPRRLGGEEVVGGVEVEVQGAG